jgi:effector-binding domain-containing protein
MSLQEAGIQHKSLGSTLAATIRGPFRDRKELRAMLARVAQAVPAGAVAGPAFCVFQFVSSVRDGDEGEAGLPVSRPVENGEVKTRLLPALEVLSLAHRGPVESLRETYTALYSRAYQHGLISDEFVREVYLDANNPEGNEIEVQFILHDWAGLLDTHLMRVLGDQSSCEVMRGRDGLSLESTAEERFVWVKGAVERLAGPADDDQQYDILSSCSHVFPRSQIEKLRAVYERARAKADDPLVAVDAVREFMAADPGWGELPRREGRIIFSSKKPRDPKAYAGATDEAGRRRAYCFCPLVRNHLDGGMPVHFCYCGAGWYRPQWEGALGKPVRVEIVESLLKSDDRCTFAIHLPEDL